MAEKPENRFYRRVHKALKYAYPEKNNNMYRGGTWDCFYEGDNGYFFIEYKWLKQKPKRTFTPGLTALQLRWGKRAYEHKRQPWVVVAFPGGCYVLRHPACWEGSQSVGDYSLFSVKDLARAIDQRLFS